MGGFSLVHGFILLFSLGISVTVIGLIVWFLVRASKRPEAAPPAASSRLSVAARLQELTDLKDKRLITDKEYEQQRASILRGV